MKTNVIRLFAASMLLVAFCSSCERMGNPATRGANVLFRAGAGGTESGSKAAYQSNNLSISWTENDVVRIWCNECSEPTEKYADYWVTPGSASEGALVNLSSIGLRWGDESTTHRFYAVYPSPFSTTDRGDAGDLGDEFTFTGHIPAAQGIAEYSSTTGKSVAAPDMKNMYLVTPKTDAMPSGTKSDIFLSFTPLSTAIEFTITNAMTTGPMQVESVSIVSKSHNISGAFEADLTTTWAKPAGWCTEKYPDKPIYQYERTYPKCSEPSDKDGQGNRLTISFRGTKANNPGIAKDSTLRFTFFLLPVTPVKNGADFDVTEVDDLYFVITRKEGSGTKTLNTKLCRTDGVDDNKIPFPTHKKTFVKGILVPDGAHWTVSYGPDVDPWGDNCSDLPFYYPDVSQIVTVTGWNDNDVNPGFQPE